MSEHHWRNEFPSNFFGSHLMPANGEDLIVKIKGCGPENLTTTDGSSKRSLVLHFEGDILPLVLNKTNARQIAKLLKENDYTKWAGHRIQLYVDHKVKAFGEIVDGIRIRPKLPEAVTVKCAMCKKEVKPAYNMTPSELVAYTAKKYGKKICAECAEKIAKGDSKE